MSVISRETSSVITDSGDSISVITESFLEHQNAFLLYDPINKSNPVIRVFRSELNSFKIGILGWGSGVRALFLTGTQSGKITRVVTPVIAMYQLESNQSQLLATVIESAVDPVLAYNPVQKKYTLYYWVNAWSPPPLSTTESSATTLFAGVQPPVPIKYDFVYELNPSYQGPQPPSGFTTIRDVPNWYLEGTEPHASSSIDITKFTIPTISTVKEHLGPFDISRFWIAPFTDGQLFRFPNNYDPFPAPPQQNPSIPPSPPSPPPPPGVVQEPPTELLDQFPFLRYPDSFVTREINNCLYNVQNNIPLTNSQRSSLDTYAFALERIAGLARCSRVLMKAEGLLYSFNRQDDADQALSSLTPLPPTPPTDSSLYLVVNHPTPVLSVSRGINKVLLSRPKLTSYLGLSTYITGALTYRFPAAASVSLTAGDPQVDFSIHAPSDVFGEYRRMGILPESLTPQNPPYASGAVYTIAGPYGTNLIEILSLLAIW